jgi:hypothetical protein
MFDDSVEKPISALRFIASASGGLRRTASTPHSAGFARLDLGFSKESSKWMIFWIQVKKGRAAEKPPGSSYLLQSYLL